MITSIKRLIQNSTIEKGINFRNKTNGRNFSYGTSSIDVVLAGNQDAFVGSIPATLRKSEASSSTSKTRIKHKLGSDTFQRDLWQIHGIIQQMFNLAPNVFSFRLDGVYIGWPLAELYGALLKVVVNNESASPGFVKSIQNSIRCIYNNSRISKQLRKLKPGASDSALLIPICVKQHMMSLQVSKKSNEDFSLVLVNTGGLPDGYKTAMHCEFVIKNQPENTSSEEAADQLLKKLIYGNLNLSSSYEALRESATGGFFILNEEQKNQVADNCFVKQAEKGFKRFFATHQKSERELEALRDLDWADRMPGENHSVVRHKWGSLSTAFVHQEVATIIENKCLPETLRCGSRVYLQNKNFRKLMTYSDSKIKGNVIACVKEAFGEEIHDMAFVNLSQYNFKTFKKEICSAILSNRDKCENLAQAIDCYNNTEEGELIFPYFKTYYSQYLLDSMGNEIERAFALGDGETLEILDEVVEMKHKYDALLDFDNSLDWPEISMFRAKMQQTLAEKREAQNMNDSFRLYSQTLRDYDRLIEEGSTFYALFLGRGEVHLWMTNHGKIPEGSNSLRKYNGLYLAKKNFKQAIVHYKKSWKAYEGLAKCYLYESTLYNEWKGKNRECLRKAVIAAKKAIEVHPLVESSYFTLVRCYEDILTRDPCLGELAGIKKDLVKTYLEIANILMEKKDYQGAMSAYNRAQALAPEDNAIGALQVIAQSKAHKKSIEDAPTRIEDACEVNPETDVVDVLIYAWSVLMNKRSTLGRMLQSVNRLTEIYKSNKIDDKMKVEVLSAIAEGLAFVVKWSDIVNVVDDEHFELADPFLHIAHLTKADRAKSLLARGQILHVLAQHPEKTYFLGEAVRILEKATELEPTNPLLWCELGQCYQEAQNSLKAVESYDQALALNPNNTTALTNGATENSKVGRVHRSFIYLLKAILQTGNTEEMNAILKRVEEIMNLGECKSE